MAAPASSAASPGNLLSQMDLSKAQAGAEMAPTDPAAAPLGEAHGRGGVQAASLGSRGLLGAMPAGRCVESHWGRAAPVLPLFKTINFLLFFSFFFFPPLL